MEAIKAIDRSLRERRSGTIFCFFSARKMVDFDAVSFTWPHNTTSKHTTTTHSLRNFHYFARFRSWVSGRWGQSIRSQPLDWKSTFCEWCSPIISFDGIFDQLNFQPIANNGRTAWRDWVIPAPLLNHIWWNLLSPEDTIKNLKTSFDKLKVIY